MYVMIQKLKTNIKQNLRYINRSFFQISQALQYSIGWVSSLNFMNDICLNTRTLSLVLYGYMYICMYVYVCVHRIAVIKNNKE